MLPAVSIAQLVISAYISEVRWSPKAISLTTWQRRTSQFREHFLSRNPRRHVEMTTLFGQELTIRHYGRISTTTPTTTLYILD
jgi:hypothetical protein